MTISSEDLRSRLIEMSAYSVMNALRDHYDPKATKLSMAEYWKSRAQLSGIQSLDSYVQNLVSVQVDNGITAVETIVSNAKRSFGL